MTASLSDQVRVRGSTSTNTEIRGIGKSMVLLLSLGCACVVQRFPNKKHRDMFLQNYELRLKIPWGHKAGQPRFAVGIRLCVRVAGCGEAMPPSPPQLISTGGSRSLCHLPVYKHDPSLSSLQLQHQFEPVLSCLHTPSPKEINFPKSE